MANENWSLPYGPATGNVGGGGNDSDSNTSTSYGGGGYGGGGYEGGGSGGGSSMTPEQEKAAANLGGIAGWNAGTQLGAAKNADKVFDISDEQNANMRNIEAVQSRRNASNDWYTQQQRLQSVTSQLREAQGNALRGSNLYDMLDLIARKDDMDDVEVLNSLRENLNNVDNDYWKALMSTNNARNEMYIDTEENLRDIAADYAAQLNSIHPDAADEIIDAEGHSLNPPSWLQTSYFDEHVRPALVPDERPLTRPEDALQATFGLSSTTNQQNTASAGAEDYWKRMYGGYNRRGENK